MTRTIVSLALVGAAWPLVMAFYAFGVTLRDREDLMTGLVSRDALARGIVSRVIEAKGRSAPSTGAPFLRQIVTLPELTSPAEFPFTIPAFSGGIDLTLRSKVTFFVGENGSGKSTLLEALAECCGCSPEGGSRDHLRASFTDRSLFAQALRLSWQPKVVEGFFLRAESFYNVATVS